MPYLCQASYQDPNSPSLNGEYVYAQGLVDQSSQAISYVNEFQSLCYADCKLHPSAPALESGESLFYDPTAKRCTKCHNSNQGCRKVVKFKLWYLCTRQSVSYQQFHKSIIDNSNQFTMERLQGASEINIDPAVLGYPHIDSSSQYFQQKAQEWDMDLYTEFHYEMNLIVGAIQSENNACYLSLKDSITNNIKVKSQMGKYVYRILKKKLTINTVLFTDGQKNFMYAELGFKKGVSLTFEGFSSVEINNIKFVNIDKVDYLFQINFLNMMPLSGVKLSRIHFGDEETTKSFFQFHFDS